MLWKGQVSGEGGSGSTKIRAGEGQRKGKRRTLQVRRTMEERGARRGTERKGMEGMEGMEGREGQGLAGLRTSRLWQNASNITANGIQAIPRCLDRNVDEGIEMAARNFSRTLLLLIAFSLIDGGPLRRAAAASNIVHKNKNKIKATAQVIVYRRLSFCYLCYRRGREAESAGVSDGCRGCRNRIAAAGRICRTRCRCKNVLAAVAAVYAGRLKTLFPLQSHANSSEMAGDDDDGGGDDDGRGRRGIPGAGRQGLVCRMKSEQRISRVKVRIIRQTADDDCAIYKVLVL